MRGVSNNFQAEYLVGRNGLLSKISKRTFTARIGGIVVSIFEALMMLGFGLAWPCNIYKSIKTKTAAGKSFAFMITIELAYLCGVIHKVFYNFDAIIWLYIANFVMVLVDLMLMIRNRKLDSARAAAKTVSPRGAGA